jgi:hypothetical protein
MHTVHCLTDHVSFPTVSLFQRLSVHCFTAPLSKCLTVKTDPLSHFPLSLCSTACCLAPISHCLIASLSTCSTVIMPHHNPTHVSLPQCIIASLSHCLNGLLSNISLTLVSFPHCLHAQVSLRPLFHSPTAKVFHCHTDPLSHSILTHCPIVLLPIVALSIHHCLTAPLSHCPYVSLTHCLTAHCLSGPLSYSLLPHCLNALLPQCPTVSLFYCNV